jgi:carbon storage regulator
MLVLSRKQGESIHIGGNVTVTVLAAHGKRVSIGLNAPEHVRIVRQELLDRDDQEARSTSVESRAFGGSARFRNRATGA